MNIKYWFSIVYLFTASICLSGCLFSSESQQAREVVNQFWQAVLNDDMDTAKNLTTWDSTQYLQFLNSKSVFAKRFETGEIKIDGTIAEVATLLYGGEKGDMAIPVRTVLVRNKDVWQVDVQKTMGSMVSGAMDAVADQLNIFMENGLKDLDSALSKSVDELNQSLKQGIDELKNELSSPPSSPVNPSPPSNGHAI
ncbi:hypothetical protein [Thiothrix lacustris]|uniref:hypothetical protein n=1 Tax=Thiothrix lacustris TaxID=525917 RepID=UPI000490B4D4|nr:hypothetical protein [Thiothrix lacustris]